MHIFQYQDMPLDVGDVVEETENAIQALGGLTPAAQSATLVSLAIGVVLLVVVWAWSRTRDDVAFRHSLREQAEYTQKMRRETDNELEKERSLRREKEDSIGELKRRLDDCNDTLVKFQAINGEAVKMEEIPTAPIEKPSSKDEGNVENAINLPTLSVSQLMRSLPAVEADTEKPITRARARKISGLNSPFE